MSTDTELVAFSDEDILYYKLHGSIEAANTEQGRLILTKEDYRYYETHRKALFRRLRKDLASRTFLFVGYSLRDDNFRAVLEDCRHELGTQTLPLSFAVRPDFGTAEEAFWREKYNIQLVNCDGSDFLASLRDAWESQNYSVVPLDVRRTKLYADFDLHTRFERVAESFFRIRPEDCTGLSIPKRFFSGQEPSWSDIRDEIPPPRKAYDAVFEAVFLGIADPSVYNSAFLVTGAAGTGKTTLIRTLAFGLAKLGCPFSSTFLKRYSKLGILAR